MSAPSQSPAAERMRERTKLRYMGDCKCGKCQLVPLDLVYEAAALLSEHDRLTEEVVRLREALQRIKRDNAQYNFGSKLLRIVNAALKETT